MALNSFPSISKKAFASLQPHFRFNPTHRRPQTVATWFSWLSKHENGQLWIFQVWPPLGRHWLTMGSSPGGYEMNTKELENVPARRSYSLQMISSHECLPHIMALHCYLQTLDTAQWSRKVLPWTLWTVDPGKPERRRTRRPLRGPSGPALPGATLRKHSHAYACKFWSAGLNPTVCASVTTLTGFFGRCAQPRPCEVVKPTVVP